jgi:hypothetical protein
LFDKLRNCRSWVKIARLPGLGSVIKPLTGNGEAPTATAPLHLCPLTVPEASLNFLERNKKPMAVAEVDRSTLNTISTSGGTLAHLRESFKRVLSPERSRTDTRVNQSPTTSGRCGIYAFWQR